MTFRLTHIKHHRFLYQGINSRTLEKSLENTWYRCISCDVYMSRSDVEEHTRSASHEHASRIMNLKKHIFRVAPPGIKTVGFPSKDLVLMEEKYRLEMEMVGDPSEISSVEPTDEDLETRPAEHIKTPESSTPVSSSFPRSLAWKQKHQPSPLVPSHGSFSIVPFETVRPGDRSRPIRSPTPLAKDLAENVIDIDTVVFDQVLNPTDDLIHEQKALEAVIKSTPGWREEIERKAIEEQRRRIDEEQERIRLNYEIAKQEQEYKHLYEPEDLYDSDLDYGDLSSLEEGDVLEDEDSESDVAGP